ncbi:MAG: GNAT family N-acetyltransferase [Bacteriovorax sp.]|nr:GNAT family N-acetyltransferase [Bacteriovorax sp.]
MFEYNIFTIEGHQTLTSEMAFVLSELDRQYFPTPWDLESWTHLFFGHDRLLIALKVDKEVIGFCLFDKSAADSFAHLLKILINPEYRNKGLSKKLLRAALINLETAGCSQFFLEVEEDNHAAQKLYSSAGFQIIHRKKDFYGTNRSALIMIKANKSHS